MERCSILSDARVVSQRGDNSCLFHSLSFCLSYDGIVPSIHDDMSGFRLREQICSYIRDHEDVVISISPDEQRTLSEAVGMDGYTCSSYCAKMLDRMEWGSVIEISTAAEMFSIGIRIYVPVSGKRYFTLLGTYRCIGFDSNTREIYLLYTGFNHYDALVDWSSGGNYVGLCSVDSSSSYLGRQIHEYNISLSLAQRRRLIRKRVSTVNLECLGELVLSTKSTQYMSRRTPTFSGLSDEAKRTNRRLRIERRASTRRSITNPSSRSSCAIDASLYAKNYDLLTRFIVCGICGLEGPGTGAKLICDMQHIIDASGLTAKFKLLTTVQPYMSTYDCMFVDDLLRVFEDGIIIGCTYLCSSCCDQLKGKKKCGVISDSAPGCADDAIPDIKGSDHTMEQYEMMYEGEECKLSPTCSEVVAPSSCNQGSAVRSYCVPKLALFNGLFAGTIPVELIGLTRVEESMINIYSSVTKMFLAGGKHYKVKGGTSYTIVNDLTSVAKHLPRMPSIEDTAVMRHKKTDVGKEYKYRPFRVYSALNWLKEHNHLYCDIEIIWPINVKYWQETTIPVDIPFIELTDDEACDIDGGNVADDEVSDEYTTNTGII